MKLKDEMLNFLPEIDICIEFFNNIIKDKEFHKKRKLGKNFIKKCLKAKKYFEVLRDLIRECLNEMD